MTIDVKNADEFQHLLDSIVRELVDANIVFKLHMDLVSSLDRFDGAMKESWTFWSLTLQSTLDAAIFRLCKIYDQNMGSLHLRSLLETVKSNPQLFAPEEYAKRVGKDTEIGRMLAQDPPVLDPNQLAKDIEFSTADEIHLSSNL